ncbi:MAG: Fic family protein [Verrucomicrobiales bacterium]
MNTPTERDFFEEIRPLLEFYPGGVGLEGIEKELVGSGVKMSRRTILRRLDALLADEAVERIGQGRGTRYRLPKPMPEWPPQVPGRASADKATRRRRVRYGVEPGPAFLVREGGELESDSETHEPAESVPMLPDAAEVRDRIRQPLAVREVVGYRREFLENYTPNESAYLPENLRRHLQRAGQTESMAKLAPGTYARRVLDRLIIDLSWNSSRLEGNTFSLLETDELIRRGHTDDEGRFRDAQMILNHKAAIEFLCDAPDELGYNRYTFLNLHALLADGLLDSPAMEGSVRRHPVGVSGTAFRPENTPGVLDECFDQILGKAGAISDPLEQAFFLLVHLPYLQPFIDGNKRTSRLAANIPLIKGNLAPLSFIGVPVRSYTDAILGVYELNRIEPMRDVFAFAYEKSAKRYADICGQLGEPDPVAVRYREEIKACVRHVVVSKLNRLHAADAVRRWAGKEITADDRSRFIEIVEEQLLALTEGNSARMRLRKSEFEAWWPVWSA